MNALKVINKYLRFVLIYGHVMNVYYVLRLSRLVVVFLPLCFSSFEKWIEQNWPHRKAPYKHRNK